MLSLALTDISFTLLVIEVSQGSGVVAVWGWEVGFKGG